MNAQHTPGPWKVHRFQGGKIYVVTNPPASEADLFKGHVIASQTTCPDWEANAHLISAAPELLSALVMFLDEYANGLKGADSERNKRPEVIAARAAIAKATGGAK